ncbi:hypothetical protein R1flu_010504 [Riccia fluitans]|uniref:Uncharacterized protein n=1 Tax=Riccia fluitans TaxID=41844 RepID=A0ABD1Z9B5_9MARC
MLLVHSWGVDVEGWRSSERVNRKLIGLAVLHRRSSLSAAFIFFLGAADRSLNHSDEGGSPVGRDKEFLSPYMSRWGQMTTAKSSMVSRRNNARRGRTKSRSLHSEIRPSSVPDYVLRRTRRIYLDHFKLLTPSMSLSAFNYRLCKLLTRHNQMMTLCMSLPNQQMNIINHHYQLLASTMCVLSYINSAKTPLTEV